MDIQELKSFTLADAVKFHDKLNPKLWFGTKLLPTAKKQLMTIAQDFVEFMGISNLDIKDITISGSNAAYSYTPHSDIDLHILVDFKKLPEDEVYQELFGAKKTLYNEKHDITVHKIPVELYVQDTNQEHTSLGEYSLLNDKWIKIPKKRRANFDERATKAKYEKLGELVELALKSNDLDQVTKVLDIIKRYRRAGLSKAGEFGPENLAFKAVRAQGLIQKLFDKKAKLHSKKISTENMYEQSDKDHYLGKLAQAASAQRGEPEIAMVNAQRAIGGGVLSFVLEHVGDIYNRMHNTGYGELDDYNSIEERRYVVLDKIEKTLRTLTRKYGFEREHKENLEANARFNAEHNSQSLEDYKKGVDVALKRYAIAHSKLPVYNRPQALAREASIALGEGNFSKAANRLFALKDIAENEKLWHEEINKFSEATTEDWHPNEEPPGPEFRPTMPKGTVRVDVSDVYDWYKLGQHISNLKGLGKHDFGKGPPSTILSFGDEDTEHKYIQDLEKTGLTTTDIDPPGGKKKQKVDPTYNVNEGTGTKIDARRVGDTIWIDYFEVPVKGKGLGKAEYEKFEKSLPKDIKKIRLIASDAGYGPTHDFWDKMGFDYAYPDDDNEMVKLLEASGYIPSEREKNDPRFKTALTVDVKPDAIKKNAEAFGFKVNRKGIPPLLKK